MLFGGRGERGPCGSLRQRGGTGLVAVLGSISTWHFGGDTMTSTSGHFSWFQGLLWPLYPDHGFHHFIIPPSHPGTLGLPTCPLETLVTKNIVIDLQARLPSSTVVPLPRAILAVTS